MIHAQASIAYVPERYTFTLAKPLTAYLDGRLINHDLFHLRRSPRSRGEKPRNTRDSLPSADAPRLSIFTRTSLRFEPLVQLPEELFFR